MRLRTLLLAGSLLGAFFVSAYGQSLQPTPVTQVANFTANGSFQVGLAASNGNRFGCLVQNQGTHVMYIFIGAGTASTAKSLQLPAPGTNSASTFNCGNPNGAVIQDEIQVEGTNGDAYVVTWQ